MSNSSKLELYLVGGGYKPVNIAFEQCSKEYVILFYWMSKNGIPHSWIMIVPNMLVSIIHCNHQSTGVLNTAHLGVILGTFPMGKSSRTGDILRGMCFTNLI